MLTFKVFKILCICITLSSFRPYCVDAGLFGFSTIVDKIIDMVNIPGAEPVKEVFAETLMEPTQLIRFYGYPAENQSVTTKDNYILLSHRIQHGKTGPKNSSSIPVVLLHSLTCASTQWFDNGAESLAFILADEGYDVWSSNLRGSIFTYHKTHARDSKQFWDFSGDDYALIDLPAIIDDVLKKTNSSKLFLIGHSLGSVVGHLTLAAKPEYNNKIIAFLAMAPILFPKYLPALINFLLKRFDVFLSFLSLKGQNNVFSMDRYMAKLSAKFCFNPSLCLPITYSIFGYSPYLRNMTRLPIVTYHCTGGISTKILRHMIQIYKGQILKMFDYGKLENLKIYNTSSPPEYNLSQVTTPTIIFHAPNDAAATPLDIARLVKKLPNVISRELFPNPTASHADYLWACNAKELVYDKVLSYLKQFQ